MVKQNARLLELITDELLSSQEDSGKLRSAATELYSLFSSLTGIVNNSDHADDLEESRLASGKAIPPQNAATCILDYGRTSKFLKATYAAILEAQKRFPDTTIEILYAGCGPFAPLAIPLTSRFSSAEIQFTLIDVHKRSLDAAQHIFQSLGLTAFARDYVLCDAAAYQHNAPQPIHIVLTETMQAALEKEPQVAITLNLAPQICPGGIFIPERIAIDVCLTDLTKEFASVPVEAHGAEKGRRRTELGRIFELTADSCRNLIIDYEDRHVIAARCPNSTIDVPMDIGEQLNLMLLTTVSVFDSIVLGDYESGLTCPKVLHDLGKISGGARIEFSYCLGDKPGFKYRFL